MNIRIKATSVTLSPSLSEFVNKCLNKVSGMIGNDTTAQCDVELARTSQHHQKGDIFKAEIHITGEGIDAYASAEGQDLNTCINDVRDEILREIRSGKGKRISYIRRSGARVKAMIKGIWPFK